MDKDIKLLLGYIKFGSALHNSLTYTTHILFYIRLNLKKVLWVGLQYVNVAFPGLTQLVFVICLALLHSYCSFQISTNGT